jgi:hypothetical protein
VKSVCWMGCIWMLLSIFAFISGEKELGATYVCASYLAYIAMCMETTK